MKRIESVCDTRGFKISKIYIEDENIIVVTIQSKKCKLKKEDLILFTKYIEDVYYSLTPPENPHKINLYVDMKTIPTLKPSLLKIVMNHINSNLFCYTYFTFVGLCVDPLIKPIIITLSKLGDPRVKIGTFDTEKEAWNFTNKS